MMNRFFSYDDTKSLRTHPAILGALTIVTLIGTFFIDMGTQDGVASWAPYSLAIVLALQWKGAGAIVLVTVSALILMVSGLLLKPSWDLQMATTNRSIGAATLTSLALLCLYIDWRRTTHRKRTATSVSRLNHLRLFLNSLKKAPIVLSDVRGRVTERNEAARKLIGTRLEEIIGQPIYRIFHHPEAVAPKWSRTYRKARREGKATQEVVCQAEDGSRRSLRAIVKPLRNQFGHLQGYSLTFRPSTSTQHPDRDNSRTAGT